MIERVDIPKLTRVDEAAGAALALSACVLEELRDSPRALAQLDGKRGVKPHQRYRHQLAALAVVVRFALGESQRKAISEVARCWGLSAEMVRKDIFYRYRGEILRDVEEAIDRDALPLASSRRALRAFKIALEGAVASTSRSSREQWTPTRFAPRVARAVWG